MHIDHEQWHTVSGDELSNRVHSASAQHRVQRWVERWLQPPSQFSAALGDGLGWLIGAIAARVVINVLLTTTAHLWFPGIVLLSLPVLIAVFIVNAAPELGWVLGYRLLLVLFGLLLGGRL